jgi:hypothetical protein
MQDGKIEGGTLKIRDLKAGNKRNWNKARCSLIR